MAMADALPMTARRQTNTFSTTIITTTTTIMRAFIFLAALILCASVVLAFPIPFGIDRLLRRAGVYGKNDYPITVLCNNGDSELNKDTSNYKQGPPAAVKRSGNYPRSPCDN
ncbi:hypothetical protein H4219_001512 [Mycoemilia scoparia]|uniref:Uncharacterized protein n=1 Tax=Mycoemilia scoparia TaxID=417184 RepID=A0A9W8A6G0_9FUNG|nr:hypothetical protein H4219_001512 [Mycoemilia scoparia]